MFFVVQLRHRPDGSFMNNVFPCDGLDGAKHQHWANMSAYGNDPAYDYTASLIIDEMGILLKTDVADHRASAEAQA